MPSRIMVFSLGLLLASTACLDPIGDNVINPPGTGSIVGLVRDACDATPLMGVSVTLHESVTRSDAAGAFRFDGVRAGSQRLLFALAEYEVLQRTVQVDEGTDREVTADLLPLVREPAEEGKLDVLFVIDNSGSMAQEQEALRQGFAGFVTTLEQAGKLDVRVGVITSDLGAGNYGSAIPSCETEGGDRGALQVKARLPGCPLPADNWIAFTPTTDNVAEGTPAEAFSCIAALGIEGCGFEQPLEAMRRALDPELNTNAGFLRDDAVLAVIVLSDEDDCSAKDGALFDPTQQGLSDPLGPLTSFRCFEFGVRCDINDRSLPGPRQNCVPRGGGSEMMQDPAEYVAFLQQLKARPTDVFFATIAAPITPVDVGKDGPNPTLLPSCRTSSGFAVPPIRLNAVVEALAPRSATASICSDDFGASLVSFAQKIVTAALMNACGS